MWRLTDVRAGVCSLADDAERPVEAGNHIDAFRQLAPQRFGAMIARWRQGGAGRSEVEAIRRFGHCVRVKRMELALAPEQFVTLSGIEPLQLLLIESGLATRQEIAAAISPIAAVLRLQTADLEQLLNEPDPQQDRVAPPRSR